MPSPFTAQSSLGIQKMVLDSGAVTLGNPDSLYTTLQTIHIATAGDTVLIPAGIWMVLAVADVSVQICTDGDTTWATYLESGQGGVVISDGYSFRIASSASANALLVGLA